jgi:uncharacterized membrane protein YcfT
MAAAAASHPRVDWVDVAKGICIVLVVMMHATLGVEKATGAPSWLNGFIHWAAPFRMPDFFLISGLFLASRIDRPWANYLDSKVLHFAYFYVLWMTIQFAMKGPGIAMRDGPLAVAEGWAMGLIQPFGTLWFIYLLAIFFVVTKALRNAPPLLVFAAAAGLEMAPVETGWLVIDEFAARFVYFFAGYWLAKHVFAFAGRVSSLDLTVVCACLLIWASVNTLAVESGVAALPGAGLALGFAGAAAVITLAILLLRLGASAPLRFCGENTLPIYLSFFVFMAASRSLLLRFVPGMDLALVSLIVTAAGVTGPLVLHRITRNTWGSFLFARPAAFRLSTAERGWHSAAHAEISKA